MRHQKRINKIGRNASHRKATLANLASSLIEYRRIKTTHSKAKATQQFIEPLITKAKKGDLNSIRQISKKLPRKEIVNQLIHDVAPSFLERNGGYTRIIKAGFRYGDNAPMAIIEFIDRDVEAKRVDKKKKDPVKEAEKKVTEKKETTA